MLVDPVFTRIHGFGFESLQDLQAGVALLNWNGTVRETATFMPQLLPLITDLVHHLELFASLLLLDLCEDNDCCRNQKLFSKTSAQTVGH
jgi:hypothetical protein